MSDDYCDILAETTLSYEEQTELGLLRSPEYDPDLDVEDLDL